MISCVAVFLEGIPRRDTGELNLLWVVLGVKCAVKPTARWKLT
jgi:hypothetical protein